MARYDFAAQRLFIDTGLAAGVQIELAREQANYLLNVLRLAAGDELIVFNGRDGEWRAAIAPGGRKQASLIVSAQERAQGVRGDIDYLFAPLKHARLDYMVQKAVEMGAARLRPVFTRRSQAARINLERMRANAVEAAEQCGVLFVPDVSEPLKLEQMLAQWPQERTLVFCDEDEKVADPVAVLRAKGLRAGAPAAVLIGPEGGFDDQERGLIRAVPQAIAISLGPRILRADTAAVAALAAVQMAMGDWSGA